MRDGKRVKNSSRKRLHWTTIPSATIRAREIQHTSSEAKAKLLEAPYVTGVATLTLSRTLTAVLWLQKRGVSLKLSKGVDFRTGDSTCRLRDVKLLLLYTRGIAHCPYADAWRVPWVFYSNNRTRHGSRPPMPRCPYRSALESLSYMRPTN